MFCNKPGLLSKRGNCWEAFKAQGMKINQRNNSSHGFCNIFSLNLLKGSLHYKEKRTSKTPSGTTASSTQGFSPATGKGNFLIGFPPELYHTNSTASPGSHFSHHATLDQFRGTRESPTGERVWAWVLPPQPAIPHQACAKYRNSAKYLNEKVNMCSKTWDVLWL